MIYPIILANSAAGETVTHAADLPAHFATAPGIKSRFQEQLRLFDAMRFAAPLVITGAACRLAAAAQSRAANVDAAFLLEPGCSKPAAAVAAAALRFRGRPEALLLIAPATHAFDGPDAFERQLSQARTAAAQGHIVAFGAAPGCAVLGFGLLECAADGSDPGPQPAVLRPAGSDVTAASAGALHNRGVYLVRAGVLLSALQRCAPRLLLAAKAALGAAQSSGNTRDLGAAAWQRARSSSAEDAIFSRVAGLMAVGCGSEAGGMQEWGTHVLSPAEDPLVRHGGNTPAGAMTVLAGGKDAAPEDVSRQPLASGPSAQTADADPHSAAQVVRVECLELQPGAHRLLPAGSASAHLAVVQGCAGLTGHSKMRVLWPDHSVPLPAGGAVRIESLTQEPLRALHVVACPRSLAAVRQPRSAAAEAEAEAAVYALPLRGKPGGAPGTAPLPSPY